MPSFPNALKKIHMTAPARRRTADIACIALMVLTVALVAWYILVPSRYFYTSDCTDTIVWAEASLDGKAVFNPDFDYACLLPFGGQLLMLPFVALFGVGLKANIAGMLVFLLIFTAAAYFLFRAMDWTLRWRCFGVSILLLTLSSSTKLREMFWEHIIYYSLGILLLFLGAAFAFSVLKAKERRSYYIRLIPFYLWFALAACNHIETLTLFILPFTAGILGERFFAFDEKPDKRKDNRTMGLLLLMVSAVAAGSALGFKLKGDIVAGYQSAFSTFSAPEYWSGNMMNILPCWLSLLGAVPLENDPLFDFNGILNLLRIGAALVLVAAPVVTTVLYKRLSDRFSRVMVFIHWTLTALVLIAFVFGKLSGGSWRLSPIICTSVVMALILCRTLYQNVDRRRLTALLAVPLVLSGLITFYSVLSLKNAEKPNEESYALSEFLQDNGLNYGYASFWNANLITMISDSKVKVRNVNIENGAVTMKTYQSNKTWYDDIPEQAEYFLILTTMENTELIGSSNGLLNSATRTLETGQYIIFIYDKNIFDITQ